MSIGVEFDSAGPRTCRCIKLNFIIAKIPYLLSKYNMADRLDFVWVNKTLDSPSLSNCRHDRPTNSQIRSHTQTVAHKWSRVKRQIKRRPLDLNWNRRSTNRILADNSDLRSLASSEQRGADNPFIGHAVESGAPLKKEKTQPGGQRPSFRVQGPRDSTSDIAKRVYTVNTPIFHCLNGIADPFTSCSIKLDAAALDRIWYFANTWTQCAFKIPGCVGYGQAPIEQYEIRAVIQQCLNSTIHCYCLLAAASARIRYIQYKETQAGDSALAHSYARRALHELSAQIQAHSDIKVVNGIGISEEVATNMLLLAAYEVFCVDEEGAQIHLTAVRRLYKKKLSNTFMNRLQANLEILCSKVAAGLV